MELPLRIAGLNNYCNKQELKIVLEDPAASIITSDYLNKSEVIMKLTIKLKILDVKQQVFFLEGIVIGHVSNIQENINKLLLNTLPGIKITNLQ